MKVCLTTCGAWHLPRTAHAFASRSALASLWISEKNSTGIPAALYRRAWLYHLAMKPWYSLTPQIWIERAFYAHFPIWRAWFKAQHPPKFDVIQAIMGFATEPFDLADKRGALKVVDCPNSHPTTYFGYWQRECDLWCPGEQVPIPRWMFARMNRELKRADVVVVQSKFCKETMIANGIPEQKVFINPMGVDTAVFQKRTVVPPKPRFVCVGTICLRKGHQYLFPAFQIVKRALPEAELVCVGEYKVDFRKERKRWTGLFTHHKGLSQPEIATLLQTGTAFVFPSQEEGIARAQIEALAAGLPVIGTHEGGTTTLVADGVEGFIVRSNDPEQIAAAMIRIATDPELNRRMGESAYRQGAIANTWQHYGDRLLAEYARRQSARLGGVTSG